MSGGDDLSRLGRLPIGYVTQDQLQESADRITQTVQAQLKAFADELFSRFPPPAAQPPPSVALQPSTSCPSAKRGTSRSPMQQVLPPRTPRFANPRGARQETTSQQLQSQQAPRGPPARRLHFQETSAESPGPSRRAAASATVASKLPVREPVKVAPSAHEKASDCTQAYKPIADAIMGNTPFTDAIMNAPVEKLKMPTLDKYKGEGDPAEHVQNYFDVMSMLQAPEATVCRCFPVTLTGSAKLWWNALEKKSIGSFEELSRKFIHHFLADSKPKLPPHVLIQTRQEPGEDLRSYFKRFQAKRLEVEDPGSRVAMAALVAGLRSGDLSKALARKPPRNYEHLMAKAHGYMNMEDAEAYKAAAVAAESNRGTTSAPAVTPSVVPIPAAPAPAQPASVPVQATPARAPQPPKRGESKDISKNPFPRNNNNNNRGGRFVQRDERKVSDPPPVFTVLNTSLSRALDKAKDEGLLTSPPPPMRAEAHRRDQRRYCRYHRDHGHDTSECRILQRDIEDLIQRGFLKNLVAQRDRRDYPPRRDERPPRSRSPRPQQKKDDQQAGPSTRGVIHTISGGPTIGGDSNNARKRYSRRPLRVESCEKRLRVDTAISFSEEDLEGVETPHSDPIVITANIDGFEVKRIMVDTGSSVDILFLDAFNRMNIDKSRLQPSVGPLIGFTGHSQLPEGQITLPLTVGRLPCQRTVDIQFIVMDIKSAHNVILGRTALHLLRAIPSTYHQMIKFPTPGGVGVVKSDQREARACYMLSTKGKGVAEIKPVEKTSSQLEKKMERERTTPVEPLDEVSIGDESGRTLKIGSHLEEPLREELTSFLLTNLDVFAWGPEDMPGIPPEVMCHELSVDPHCKPVRQKKRHQGPERQKAAAVEVDRLMRAGFIREVQYPEWLSNVVLVKKSDGRWRMCVDYTNLNKACPKDSYPLPRIDQLVDESAGHELLSFMDAFSGYNQIQMAEHDQEKTSFVTDQGTYCYKVMPFGLKNAGATYQRLVNKIFRPQLGRNVEAYVDDLLVKSKLASAHIADLTETFSTLRRHRMKLNPAKCAFGVQSGKFLGFMITQRGIEINPEKITAIEQMPEPRSMKDIQKLNGKIAALGRFLSKSAERSLPFFKILRGTKDPKKKLEWTEDCCRAFRELKEYLSTKPLLSQPVEGETLYLYLAVSPEAVSSVLVREENQVQKPVYYVSRILKAGELSYPLVEKAAFALITTARRLRPYFQAHSVIVRTNLPLKKSLGSPTTSGRMVAWSIELSEYDVEFEPRATIKAQALADFLLESSPQGEEPPGPASTDQPAPSPHKEPKRSTPRKQTTPEVDPEECASWWQLKVDGSSSEAGSGAGVILRSPEGVVTEQSLAFNFPASNNEAEYEALIAGLRVALAAKADNLYVLADSQLIVHQVNGKYAAKDKRMAQYLEVAKKLVTQFANFKLSQVPRSLNARADALSKLASTSISGGPGPIYTDTLPCPSITKPGADIMQADAVAEPCWMDPLIHFLSTGAVPSDPVEARSLQRNARRYLIIDGRLYRLAYTSGGVGPYLRCLRPSEARYVMKEIHEGACGNHPGARTLAQKVIRQGYYWPTIIADSRRLVSTCKKCQFFSTIPRAAPTELTSLLSPIPFAQWGLDLLGPLPLASGQRKFLIVAIDYFTKWIEAEPLAKIGEANITSFAWKSLVCRFGVPLSFVTDNGTQFDSQGFRDFCKEWGIRLKFASVAHPKCNGLAEAANKCILQALKKKVDKAVGNWVEELPSILWSYRTTHKNSTGESPFMLTFGAEAVTPVEVGLPTVRLQRFDEDVNSASLRTELDLLEEVRERALRKQITNQQRVARYYNSKVRPRRFQVGDLVLRKAAFDRDTKRGKLAPNWEGPYTVLEEIRPGTYRLRSPDGRVLQHPWNIEHLKKFFQ